MNEPTTTSDRARHATSVPPWSGVSGACVRLAAGAAMIALGSRRRGVIGTLVTSAGGVLVQRALGRLFSHAYDVLFSERPDLDRRYGEGSRDLVEESSWESFPASDPPAFNH